MVKLVVSLEKIMNVIAGGKQYRLNRMKRFPVVAVIFLAFNSRPFTNLKFLVAGQAFSGLARPIFIDSLDSNESRRSLKLALASMGSRLPAPAFLCRRGGTSHLIISDYRY